MKTGAAEHTRLKRVCVVVASPSFLIVTGGSPAESGAGGGAGPTPLWGKRGGVGGRRRPTVARSGHARRGASAVQWR